MPELPEVETIVRGLRKPLEGKVIRAVEVVRPDLLREPPDDFAHHLLGRRIERVDRRGKNIVITLDRDVRLIVNLGMTGRLLIGDAETGHPGVRFVIEGDTLVYDDVRRFGVLERLTREEWEARSRALGPEPLGPDFTVESLGEALRLSRSPVRSWLLDQRRVAGVGNIYANEALYRAGIHPARPAAEVNPAEAEALHRSIRDVLRSAIESRGTTLRDYRDSSGERGSFFTALRVYGRGGLPCHHCPGTIRRVVFGNRSAFYCPECQPHPGHDPDPDATP